MDKTRTIDALDPETGEILGRVEVLIPRKVRWREDWYMGMQSPQWDIAKDRSLGWEAGRLLFALLASMDFENHFRMPLADIGRALDMRKQNVARALAALVSRNILVEGPRIAGGPTYRMNSHLAWKGRVNTLRSHRATVPEPNLRLVHGSDEASG